MRSTANLNTTSLARSVATPTSLIVEKLTLVPFLRSSNNLSVMAAN